MADHIGSGLDHVAGACRKHGRVRPDEHVLPVGFGGDGAHQLRQKIGVNLDRGCAGAVRFGHRDRQIGLAGDRTHPRYLARRFAAGRLGHTWIVEERGPRHQGGVVNVWRGDLGLGGGTPKVGEKSGVPSHVAHCRHAAVNVATQQRESVFAVRRACQVNVRVDQPRQAIKPADVDDLRAGCLPGRKARRRQNRCDALAFDHDRHVWLRRRAGAIDQRGALVDDRGVACCERRTPQQRQDQTER